MMKRGESNKRGWKCEERKTKHEKKKGIADFLIAIICP